MYRRDCKAGCEKTECLGEENVKEDMWTGGRTYGGVGTNQESRDLYI